MLSKSSDLKKPKKKTISSSKKMKYKTLNNTNIHREQNKQKNNWNNSSVIINRKVIQGGGVRLLHTSNCRADFLHLGYFRVGRKKKQFSGQVNTSTEGFFVYVCMNPVITELAL